MGVFARILGGLVVLAIGFIMVIKTDIPLSIIGPVAWAEEHLGIGGSRLFWKLVGTGLCLIGLVIMTGSGESLFMGTIGRLLFLK
jgi:hypothetical protein